MFTTKSLKEERVWAFFPQLMLQIMTFINEFIVPKFNFLTINCDF